MDSNLLSHIPVFKKPLAPKIKEKLKLKSTGSRVCVSVVPQLSNRHNRDAQYELKINKLGNSLEEEEDYFETISDLIPQLPDLSLEEASMLKQWGERLANSHLSPKLPRIYIFVGPTSCDRCGSLELTSCNESKRYIDMQAEIPLSKYSTEKDSRIKSEIEEAVLNLVRCLSGASTLSQSHVESSNSSKRSSERQTTKTLFQPHNSNSVKNEHSIFGAHRNCYKHYEDTEVVVLTDTHGHHQSSGPALRIPSLPDLERRCKFNSPQLKRLSIKKPAFQKSRRRLTANFGSGLVTA